MCENCKECLAERKDEFQNIEEILNNIRAGMTLEIKIQEGLIKVKTHKFKVYFDEKQKIIITDGENQEYLCNILDFANEIKEVNENTI